MAASADKPSMWPTDDETMHAVLDSDDSAAGRTARTAKYCRYFGVADSNQIAHLDNYRKYLVAAQYL